MAYPMSREVLFQDGFRTIVGMNHNFLQPLMSDDTIEYSFHFVYQGTPYSTTWQSKSL